MPTYDVDIMWHAHQRSAAAYSRDCISILKRVLEHDDTDSDRGEGQKLNTGFKDTCKLWENTYGTIYVKAGAMYRGDQPLLAQPPPVLEDPDFANRKLVCLEQQQQHSYLTERRTVQVFFFGPLSLHRMFLFAYLKIFQVILQNKVNIIDFSVAD